MVRKISGKRISTASVHLNEKDGTKCTERQDIANTLADEFQKNSSPTIVLTFKDIKLTLRKRNLILSLQTMKTTICCSILMSYRTL